MMRPVNGRLRHAAAGATPTRPGRGFRTHAPQGRCLFLWCCSQMFVAGLVAAANGDRKCMQMVWLLARCFSHGEEEMMFASADAILSAYSGPSAPGVCGTRAEFVLQRSGLADATALLCADASTQAAPPRAAREPVDAAGLQAAALAASRRLSQCSRGARYTLVLLAIADVNVAPLWLRVGAIAAACQAGTLGDSASGCAGAQPPLPQRAAGGGGGTLQEHPAAALAREPCVCERDLLAAAAAAADAVVQQAGGLLEPTLRAACAAATRPQAAAAPVAVCLPLFAAVLQRAAAHGTAAGCAPWPGAARGGGAQDGSRRPGGSFEDSVCPGFHGQHAQLHRHIALNARLGIVGSGRGSAGRGLGDGAFGLAPGNHGRRMPFGGDALGPDPLQER